MNDQNYYQTMTLTYKRPQGMSDEDWQRLMAPKVREVVPVPGSSPEDRDTFIGMLERWGVPWEDAGGAVRVKVPEYFDAGYDVEDWPVKGYKGFYCDWEFTDEGRFVEVSVFE